MAWDMRGFGSGRQGRWHGALTHGSVLVALLGCLGALWTAVALAAALVAHPVPTMTTIQRDGVRGVVSVVREGTETVVREVRGGRTAEPRR